MTHLEGAERILPQALRHAGIVTEAKPSAQDWQRPTRTSAFAGQGRLDFNEPESIALQVHRRLLALYGPYLVPLHERLPPLDQMLRSILGSKTRTEVSWAAFVRLRARFDSNWHSLACARPGEILSIVGDVTHAEVKAPQLVAALGWIQRQRVDLELDFLANHTPDAARAWLERINGIGPKISASVINLSTLRMPALIVDSHHHRVAQRLGLIPPRASAEAAHALLPPQLPARWSAARFEQNHAVMKAHGQVLCRYDVPNCAPCPLQDLCAHVRMTPVTPSG